MPMNAMSSQVDSSAHQLLLCCIQKGVLPKQGYNCLRRGIGQPRTPAVRFLQDIIKEMQKTTCMDLVVDL